jgi:molybdenum cofactor cytidylyltransferase
MLTLSKALRLSSNPRLAFVGAGGKTTAIFQLARQLAKPIIVTATTHLGTWQTTLADRHLIVEASAQIQSLNISQNEVILITGSPVGDKLKPISNDLLNWLRERCDRDHLPLLIEADGSRQKPLKAPAEHEPPLPEFVDTVVVVAGLSALGKPLTEEWIHRPEIFQRLCNAHSGDPITPEMMACVLTNPNGGLKNIPGSARRVALLNQADTPNTQSKASALADLLLPTYKTVLIGSLQHESVFLAREPTAGILLAAGESRRFGQPKQLLEWRGQTFIQAVARAGLAAGLDPLIVVTGSDAEQVEQALVDLPVQIVRNREWRVGQSSSIRAGLEALPNETGAAIFLLSDQPQVTPTIMRALVEQHATDLAPILAPLILDRRGNPVLFDRVTFPDLLKLKGDVGGRAIFSKYTVAYLPWHDDSLLLDVDTPEMYQRLKDIQE